MGQASSTMCTKFFTTPGSFGFRQAVSDDHVPAMQGWSTVVTQGPAANREPVAGLRLAAHHAGQVGAATGRTAAGGSGHHPEVVAGAAGHALLPPPLASKCVRGGTSLWHREGSTQRAPDLQIRRSLCRPFPVPEACPSPDALTCQGGREQGVAGGSGYHLGVVSAPASSCTPCCCTYLTCMMRRQP